jgi:hypothetical protein
MFHGLNFSNFIAYALTFPRLQLVVIAVVNLSTQDKQNA